MSEASSLPADRLPSTSIDPLHRLVALCAQRVSAFEIVNGRGEPVWPQLPGNTAARLRHCFSDPLAVEIRAVLDAATRHSSVVFADIGGLRVAAIDLRPAVAEDLTLLLAERQTPRSARAQLDDLTRTGRWLARAIRRSSTPASDPSHDWQQLHLLHRILTDAAASGSDVTVVQALVDALAIWLDTDTRAYGLAPSSEFVLEIALAGADPNRAPRVIDGRRLPSLVGPAKLSAADAERLGFKPGVDVVIETIEDRGSTPWLLAHLGAVGALDEERLALFSELLVPAVRTARSVEVARLMWSLTEKLAATRLSAPEAGSSALRVLGTATRARATLTLRRSDGTRVAELGDAPSTHPPPEGTPLLRLALDLAEPFHAKLSLWRTDDGPFTVREQGLAQAGAGVLASWLSTTLQRGELTDRQFRLHRLDPTLDRRRRRPARPDDVSLLVIRPEATQSSGEVRDVWVGRIGRRLRPSDVTGALPTGEIGVLLPESGMAAAHVVVERLRRAFEEDHALSLLERAAIGIATSCAAASDIPTLLGEARREPWPGSPGLNGSASP